MAPRKPRRSSYETYLAAYKQYAKNNIMESDPLTESVFNNAMRQARMESVRNPARQVAADQQKLSTKQQQAAGRALKQLEKYHPLEAELIRSTYAKGEKLTPKEIQENFEAILNAAGVKSKIKLRANNSNYEEWLQRKNEFEQGIAIDAEELFSPPNSMKKKG